MQTATNPQTGEKVQWDGSAWVPLGAGAPGPQAAPQQGPITLGTPKPEKPTSIPGYDGWFMGRDGQPFRPEGLPEKPPAARSATEIELEAKEIAAQKRASTIQAITGEVKRLYQQDIKGQPASRGFGALEYVDSIPTNDRFRAAGNTILPLIRPLVAQTAKEGDSDKEMQVFLAYVPSNDDSDIAIEQKFKMLDMLVGGMVDGKTPSQTLGELGGAVAPSGGSEPPQGPSAPVYDANLGGQQVALSQNGTETVDNPELAGVRGEYLQRLDAGQSAGEIIPWLRQAGITDPQLLRTALQQIQYRKQNPGVPVSKYNTDALDDMDVPLSAVEGAMNDLGQSAPGAYLMRAGNAVSMNTLDDVAGAMGGNAERVRIGLEDAGNSNPVASFAGDLSGGVMAAFGAEAGLAARGVGAGLGRAVSADMLYGAGAGAGAAEGDRLIGAAKGSLSGLVGSVGGQVAAKGAGSMISPTGGRLADVYAQGGRPTVGQRLANANDGAGLSGMLGRAVNATEEAAQSVPFAGAAIQGARQAPRDAWQLGGFDEALKEIGEKLPKGMKPGTAPHAYTEKAFGKVYDKAREGMVVAADEQLASEVGQLGEQIGNLAEPSIKRFENIVRNTVMRRAGEVIDGPAYKKIQSELGKTIRGIRKSQSGDGELADALDELSGILDNAARRHSDPEAVKLLDAADRGYAKFVRIEDASRGNDAGTYTASSLASSARKNSTRVRSKAFNQGEALMQEYAAQGRRLDDRMGNSFTTDRALQAGTLLTGGAALAEPSTLGVVGALTALYSPVGRKVLGAAMAPRGPKAKAIANQVRKRARLSGAGGAVALTNQTSGGQ